MSFVNRFKSYFNKSTFDCTQEHIDPYEFHKIFYVLAKAFRVIDNQPIPRWTIMVPILISICGTIAATLFGLAVIQAIIVFDLPLITEAGTYFIIMVYMLLIISCTLKDKPRFGTLFQALRDDFHFICTNGTKHREKFLENHVWTWKASLVASIFTALIGGGIVVCAIITLVYFTFLHSEDSIRPLPFPFWFFGVDFKISPVYEFSVVFSVLCVLSQTYTYIFMMQTQIVWIRQVTSRADVMIWSIEDLLVDVQPTSNAQQKKYYEEIIKARMREITNMHLSMYSLLNDYAKVYKKLLMFEQKLCAPVVCLTAYCSAERFEAGQFPGILLLLCLSVIVLVYITSYMCTTLADKVQSIGDACFDTPFWNAPPKVIRPYFILIMQRSTRALPLQTPGFEDVSLQTFSNQMTFAYSCFNMLRQTVYEA